MALLHDSASKGIRRTYTRWSLTIVSVAAEATAAIMALVGAEAPAWVALPAFPVTRANVLEAYEAIWHRPAPPALRRVFEAAGEPS